jgi:hypothetical protein
MWSGGHVPQMGILSIEKGNWTNELWIGCVKIRFTMMYPKYGNLNRQVDFPKHWIFGVPRFGQTRDQPIVNGGLQLGTLCLYMDIKKGSGVVFRNFRTMIAHCRSIVGVEGTYLETQGLIGGETCWGWRVLIILNPQGPHHSFTMMYDGSLDWP